MINRTIIILVVTAILLVVILFFAGTYKINTSSGFNRVEKISILKLQKTLLVNDKRLYNFCGKSTTNYYFATTEAGTILQTDFQLANARFISVKLPDSLFGNINNVKTFVDYPLVNIYFGNKKLIIHAHLFNDSVTASHIPFNYTRVIEMDEKYILFRGFDTNGTNKILIKYDLVKDSIAACFKEGDFNDGGLMSDGLLNYDRITGYIVFTHYHNNNSITLDSNLRLVASYHSIDTFAHFQTSAIKTQHGFSYNKPKRSLIRHAYTFKGRLFILSLIKADNQSASDYRNNATIDVYDLNNGKYTSTFYVPLVNDKLPSNFFIENQNIITISPDNISIYNLPKGNEE